jgi:exodeoxyribonuclease VII large subunit
LQEHLQYLDDLQAALLRCARQSWRERRVTWGNLQQRLSRLKPTAVLAQRREALGNVQRRLREQAQRRFDTIRSIFLQLDARLRLLSPENVLARGYSITTAAASGKILRDAAEAQAGQKLKTRLKSGEVRSVVEK